MTRVREQLQEYVQIVDQELERMLSDSTVPEQLLEAMKYSVFPGGKRLRPVLTLAVADAAAGDHKLALAPACALELIHCCSLAHDDLPCMDDDDMRRGKPSCHVQYGEAMAVLVGDALLTLAFEGMARAMVRYSQQASQLAQAAVEVGVAAGPVGMIGGQVLDIAPDRASVAVADLDKINMMKTGALIRGAVRSGALAVGADDDMVAALSVYGEEMGRAFQLCDDLLDMEEDLADDRGNPGYPAVVGAERTRELAEAAVGRAIAALHILPEARRWFLEELAVIMLRRTE